MYLGKPHSSIGRKGAGEEAPEERMAETMSRIVSLVLVLALLGCAKEWQHPMKKTQDEYYKDVYVCQQETTESRLPKVETDRLFDSCMRARGWREK
jgi:hypothetical protein